MNCRLKTISSAANTGLEESITMEELFRAVKQGKPNKAPGQDGICLEFMKKTWELIKYDILEVMNNVQRRDNIRPTESCDTSLPAKKAGPYGN